MSDDLISRKALLEEINNFSMKITGSANAMAITIMEETKKSVVKMIDEQPTAYDVDKVVKQLEEKREKHRKDAHVQMYKYKNEDWAQYLDGMQCGIRDSIKIVKSGGIE